MYVSCDMVSALRTFGIEIESISLRMFCNNWRRLHGLPMRREKMYPVEFPEQNSVFVADGCDDLPACKQYNEQFATDEVISL